MRRIEQRPAEGRAGVPGRHREADVEAERAPELDGLDQFTAAAGIAEHDGAGRAAGDHAEQIGGAVERTGQVLHGGRRGGRAVQAQEVQVQEGRAGAQRRGVDVDVVAERRRRRLPAGAYHGGRQRDVGEEVLEVDHVAVLYWMLKSAGV